MERHRCKLCLRKFANGRALGGHMRSHMLNHAIASKPDSPPPPPPRTRTPSCETVSETESPPPSSVSRFFSSSDSEHEDEVEFTTHDNDDLGVAEPTGSSSLVTLQDRESETESFRKKNHPTRKRRSNRILQKPTCSTSFDYLYFDQQQQQHYIQNCKKSSAVDAEAEPPVSSITEVTSDEDLAFCLMMMSRDNWDSSLGTRTTTTTTATKNNNNYNNNKKKMKYKCDTCNKGFRSYQALGGHRASHKKIRLVQSGQRAGYINEHQNRVDDGSDSIIINKVHECPICLRVFASGQALGGHKRSHLLVSNNGLHHNINLLDNTETTKIITRHSFIDLNLPASVEDEDDSAVSDVHF